jgi:MFS transporter, SHS family, lactate transporter
MKNVLHSGSNCSVIPIHLLELSPEHFRAFVVGTAYQLGNLISSASATIEATAGERFPLPPLPNGETRYDYGKVMAIFMGAVYAYGIPANSTVVNWKLLC